jgi:hypothetical protein
MLRSVFGPRANVGARPVSNWLLGYLVAQAAPLNPSTSTFDVAWRS